jgi:hypothetical protein
VLHKVWFYAHISPAFSISKWLPDIEITAPPIFNLVYLVVGADFVSPDVHSAMGARPQTERIPDNRGPRV